MNKMNAEWKAKWLEALRSGRYAQGYNRLRTESGYCCLGVLCDVYGVTWHRVGRNGYGLAGRQTSYIPHDIVAVVDLAMWYRTDGPQETLSKMNDEGVGFGKIADWIEENL